MNYTLRAFALSTKINKQGLMPVVILLTIDRKVTQFKTSYKVKSENWDTDKREFKGIGSNTQNILLRKQMAEIETKVSEQLFNSRKINANTIKNPPSKLFERFAGEVRKDQKEINRLKEFGGDVLISDITVSFLRKFDAHEKKRGMSQNTRNTTFKYLRRIINQAKDEGLINLNPFDAYDIPKYQQSERIFLTLAEVDKIEAAINKGLATSLNMVAVYFLFGCYTGLRYSDWCLFNPEKHIQGDRIILRAKKNKNLVSMKIFPRLQNILLRLSDVGKPFSGQKMNQYLKQLGEVAGINKPLTNHVSRHSHAIMLANLGVSSEVVAELLGVNNQTVTYYYKVIGEKVDRETDVLKDL